MCLLVGVFPAYTVGPFLATAAQSILGADMPEDSLAVWHGVNLPLVMSVVAMTAGVVLYLALRAHQQANPGRVPFIYRFDGRRSFRDALDGSSVAASWLLRWLASSRLVQMLLIVLGTLFVAWLPLRGGWLDGAGHLTTVDPAFALLWLVGGVCAVAAAYQAKYHRLASLALAGGAGLVTCLTFVWFSAPDLALTQLSVEVVTLVLLLLGLRWLPRRIEQDDEGAWSSLKARGRRLRDLLMAVAAGGGMSALAYAVLTRPQGDTISSYFVERALPDGGGTNVVNVILVDFRGFDTFGEITVLGIVALTVYALLRRFRPAAERGPAAPAAGPGRRRAAGRRPTSSACCPRAG